MTGGLALPINDPAAGCAGEGDADSKQDPYTEAIWTKWINSCVLGFAPAWRF
jgi:hypothetical protein